MKLIKAVFKNYKILEESEFSFKEGLNFINEANEFGKSTIIEGIVDAFSLNPASLIPKKTEGKEIPPVIKIAFVIQEDTYELKINAQEERVFLKGKDGTELESPQGIKKFLAAKGYQHFPHVLEGLLVLKERDLSVGATRGLKDIFDAVLRSASVENLENRIRNEFILQRAGLRQKPFGQQKRALEEKLLDLEEKLSSLLREKEEFEKNKKNLKKIKEEIKNLSQKQKELLQKYEQLKHMRAYLELRALEQEKENLEKELKNLVAREEKLNREVLNLAEKISSLKKHIEKQNEEIAKLIAAKEKIKVLKDRLQRVEKGLCLFKEIQQKEAALGDSKNLDPEALETSLRDWKTFLALKKRARGLIKILSAKGQVFVNRIPAEGQEIAFQGRVRLEYQDLCLDIFADTKVADLSEREEKLGQKFGSPENLLSIIKKLRELKGLYEQTKYYESLDELLKQKNGLTKELESLFASLASLETKRKEHEKLKEELTRHEIQERKLQQEIFQARERSKTLSEKLSALEDEIKSFPRDFEEKLSLKTLRAYEGLSLKDISEKISQAEKSLLQMEQKLNDLEIERVRFEERVKREPDLARFEDLLREKARLEQKILRLNRLEKVLRISADLLARLNAELNREYLRNFEEHVAKYFSLITGGRYQKVSFKEESLFFDREAFAKNWEAVRDDGKRFEIDRLSDGTRAQLLLAARLALVRLFFKREAFFLFDEPFAYFDKHRRERTISILKNLAETGWQVIVMSAHK
ncbi:ATP-binding protein [Thermodesulfatator atlanticus]|uniref:ATP-binding protein n=1 Tax=Thermodesulfatator atlanticus TaxID=501497 RepID=UPI0003B6E01A|nr:AAA family ATPase [Thermodesulfatator atlanticus]